MIGWSLKAQHSGTEYLINKFDGGYLTQESYGPLVKYTKYSQVL